MASASFITNLKGAVGVAADAPLVLLGNFEVENAWGRGEAGLPRFGFEASNAIVNRMDEFALLLGGPGDVVVLKDSPDQDYLAALEALGLALPRVLVVRGSQPEHTVTQDALRDVILQDQLRELAPARAALLPHGISEDEEKLAHVAGLALAGPSWRVCKMVNSKIYSRRVAQKLGLRQPVGYACDTLQAWSEAVAWARELLLAGRRVAVKDAYGVSGKGISVVSDGRRLDRLDRMTCGNVQRTGGRPALVVEEWVAKTADLNYQFTVARDGRVRFDFVKEAVTDQGVHKGHRVPSPLTERQHGELADAANRLGSALAADGYYGVVGVDAMLDPDGGLYPVVEINARNNMSTYQVRIDDEIVGPGRATLARYYALTLRQPLSFARLRDSLDGLLLDRPGGTGIVVHGFATVNAAFTLAQRAEEVIEADSVQGRLYAMVAAADAATVEGLDAEIAQRLATLRLC